MVSSSQQINVKVQRSGTRTQFGEHHCYFYNIKGLEFLFNLQNLTNTFQATVATNGRQGYTIFQYEVGHMLWDFNVLPFQDVVIGYKCPNGESTYINDPDPQDSIDIHKRPDMYLGNTNQLGIWAYRLDSNSDTYVNPEQECNQWQAVQPDPSTWMPTDDCPCSHNQAMLDSRYELLNLTDLGIDEAVSFSWPLLPKGMSS